MVAAEFVDANGADNVLGTANDDLHLKATSGAVDHGCGTLLSADVCDLDGDSNVAEPLPVDIDGQPRLTDSFSPRTPVSATLPRLRCPRVQSPLPRHLRERRCRWRRRRQFVGQRIQAAPRRDPLRDDDAAAKTSRTLGRARHLPPDRWKRSPRELTAQGNLTVLGGFKGNESLRSQRSPSTFPTILSGAIGNSGFANNSFHVVRFAGDNVFEETILDGFFITDGNASGNGNDEFGGGMLVSGIARPTVRNCRFIGNHAHGGGGLAVVDSGSGPVAFNCYLTTNNQRRPRWSDLPRLGQRPHDDRQRDDRRERSGPDRRSLRRRQGHARVGPQHHLL